VAAVQGTCRDGLGSGNENFGCLFRTALRRQHAGERIHIDGHHPVGRRERFGRGILPDGQRALHEFSPDGQGGMRAFDIELAIVVEADPDDAEQIGRETREPAIVRGARLTRRRRQKTT